MEDYTLGKIESRFADIIWDNAPLSTARLIELCGKELGWKREIDFRGLVAMMVEEDMKNIAGMSCGEYKASRHK